jgi:hypothetical protein
MATSMEESEQRYQKIKEHFRHLIGTRALVVISDLPMQVWLIIWRKTPAQIMKEKSKLIRNDCNYVEFFSHLSGNTYLYNDENMLKSEELTTGNIDYFSDKRISRKHLELIRSELNALIISD